MYGMSNALTGLVVFVLGMIVVFLGICILIAFITLVRYIMDAVSGVKKEKPAPPKEESPEPVLAQPGVTPEVAAAITAAIMAYYEEEQPKQDFIVRRIKKTGK